MKSLNFVNLIIVFFVFLFSVSVSAQTNKKSEIKQIEMYSKTLDAFIKQNKNRHPVFADVSDYRKDTDSIWKKYNSVSAFEKAIKKIESYNIAEVWQKGDKIIAANFVFDSPSGDWVHYIEHYYREDGTLAKVQAQLNVFGLEGLISVYRNFYFDQKGKLLRKTTRYYDGTAKKWKKADQVHFMDRRLEIYKTTKELPFASLVKKSQS
jgi:hypothetical protein